VPTAVRKSFQILEAVADADEPLTAQALSDQVGLTRSTLSRLLLSLEALGYLERTRPGGGWQPGPGTLRLGLSRLAGIDIRGVATPLMRALSEQVDLPVDLAMPVGEDMLHFELAQRAGQMVLATGLGARLPMITTALGHAALFAMKEDARAEVIQRIRRSAGPGWTSLDTALGRSFDQLARHGFCVVSGMLRPEVSAVGAPFVDPRTRAIFSFSCSAIGQRREGARLEEEVGPELLRMVNEVALALGGRRPR